MCAKWLNNGPNPPQSIVARLESARIKTGKQAGELNFLTAFEVNSMLLSFVEFHPDLPECEQLPIINRAMQAAAHRGEITASRFMAEVCKAENLFLGHDEAPYVIVTSLSIKYTQRLTARTLCGVKISFAPVLPKRFSRDELSRNAQDTLGADEPTSYTWVFARTKGRSFGEASAKAMRAVELLRGIWNFHYNRRKGMSWSFGGRQKPVNEIRRGPLHTLHHPGGRLAVENVWWWEPDYTGPERTRDLDEGWQSFRRDEQWILRRLTLSPFKHILSESFCRYASALDENNLQNGFLQLWSLLESLTGTQRATYDTTVRRAAFLYDEHQFHQQILNHLRERRNRSIHRGQSQEDDQTLLYQMKRYCEQMMTFLLRARRFKTLEECWAFFDTPKDVVELEERIASYKDKIALCKWSKQFRTSKPRQEADRQASDREDG